MSGLSIGLSTFNSCNKAGSIPHFTQHLSRYPNDYQALVWRGRAYGIIGKTAEAKADFQKACCVSRGPKKCLVEALIEHHNGNMEQEGAILDYTTRQYPNCSEAWSELGCYTRHVQKKVDPALQHLGRAYHLATNNSETKEPWFPWCSQTIGDIYFYEKQEVDEARKYYATAVQSGTTLTIGHLGLSRCDILNNNLPSAETSFLTAKGLNPDLVQQLGETFDDFRQQTIATLLKHELASAFQFLSLFSETKKRRDPSSSQYFSGATHQAQGRRYASEYQGVKKGGSGGRGNGGSGDESGSDDDDLTPEKRERRWERMKKEAPSAKKYRGKRFYQSKCKSFWYSKIDPSERHGRETKSFLKKYVDRGKTIKLIGSLDENLKEMPGKHESGKYDLITKSDMDGIY